MESDRFIQAVKLAVSFLLALWLGLPWAWKALVLLNMLDVLSGLLKAGTEGEINSNAMSRGLRRKAYMWLLIMAIAVLEYYAWEALATAGVTFSVSNVFALGFALMEIISIVENSESAGLRLPRFMRRHLASIMTHVGYEKDEFTLDGDSD
jgi:toxin secretion/phage lysis holin